MNLIDPNATWAVDEAIYMMLVNRGLNPEIIEDFGFAEAWNNAASIPSQFPNPAGHDGEFLKILGGMLTWAPAENIPGLSSDGVTISATLPFKSTSLIQSMGGGFKFPDGSVQTSSAARTNVLIVNAKNSSAVDQRADIQGAINAVTEYLVGPLISNNAIELSAGQFYISKPLVLTGSSLSGLHIRGQGEHTSSIGPTLDPTYSYPTFQGPMVMWGLQQDWTHFGAPLVSGTGQSATFGQGTNGGSRILVQDARAGRLDGLTAFGVEGWFNCTSLSGSTGIITVSGGTLDSVHGAQAMSVYIQTGGGGPQLKASLTVSGVQYQITPISISYSSTYNYEFNWDNATGNILFFLNGVLQQTIGSVHGAVSQAFYEDFVIGSEALYVVNFAERWPPINGTMDSMRFSSVARNTTGYSLPTARYTSDTHTLLNLDFQTWDSEVGCWVGQAGYLIPYGNMTVYMRGFDGLNSGLLRGINSVKMSGITLQGFHYASGIAVNQALSCTWEDLYFFATSNYALQILDVNSFYNWASDIYVQSDSTWGCQWNVSSGACDGENIFVQYADWLADLKGTWNTVKLQPGSLTALPARVTTGGNTYGTATIKNLTIDAETPLPTGYLAGVIATGGNDTGPGSITFEDCFFASEGPGSHTQPALMYDNLDYLELRNCRFRVNLNAPAPYAVQRLAVSPGGKLLTCYNSTIDNDFTNAGVAWADHPEDWNFVAQPQLLATNSSGKIIKGGMPYAEADASLDATTSSASFVVMDSMTLTVPFNGTYLANFDSCGSTGTNGATLTYAFFVNGVENTDTERHKDSLPANVDGTIHITDILHNLTAGATVTVQWKVSAGSAVAHQRCFSIIRFWG